MKHCQIQDDFLAAIAVANSEEDLRRALQAAKTAMGFDFFAMTHHVDISGDRSRIIRLHDYPPAWASQFDRRRLGQIDPVHRASHKTVAGFAWTELGRFIRVNASDRAVLASARRHGIGEGYTVPTHMPGEARGSVSFAMAVGRSLPYEMLGIVPFIASHAFECARRLWHAHPASQAILTPRQRTCLTWVMRGKSDWEISQIMGCKPQTVMRHIKLARQRYGVEKRTLLVTRALWDGTLNLADLDPR
jgi:DNA-binding CsgD family transcriptional regulator